MKISFIIPRLDSVGGAEKYLVNIVLGLSKKYEVKLHTLCYDSMIFPEVKDLVEVVRVPEGILTKGKTSTIANVLLMNKLGRLIPDDYNIYNPHLFPTNFIKNKKPMIWTAHEPPRMLYDLEEETINELNGLQKTIARIYFPLLRRTDKNRTEQNITRIIANSEYSKKYFKRIYDKPVSVIRPGINKKLLQVKNKPEKKLLSVGRLYKAKRVDLVIKAFKKVQEKNPDYQLTIIGEGPEEQNLKKLAGKTPNIEFKGRVTEKQLINEYKTAKLTVYTPIREMFGMVPLESIATGTPVIGVKGGYNEVLKKGITVTRANPINIAKKIDEYIEDKKKYSNASKNGKRTAREHTWDQRIKTTEELFKKSL